MVVYELTQQAHVCVKIYTSAGRLIRVLREEGRPGENSTLVWDGRDETGDPVANGVYFMTVEARSMDEDEETISARGRLVRMR